VNWSPLRTQWTDDPSGTAGDKKENQWAGDRFDIVLLRTLEREGKGQAWRDVSEDAAHMLEETMHDKLSMEVSMMVKQS
jgi:hypothetical protein